MQRSPRILEKSRIEVAPNIGTGDLGPAPPVARQGQAEVALGAALFKLRSGVVLASSTIPPLEHRLLLGPRNSDRAARLV